MANCKSSANATENQQSCRTIEVDIPDTTVVIGEPKSDSGSKSLNRILEAIERRKKLQAQNQEAAVEVVAEPPKKRRGRKPKNIDINPNQPMEDDSFGETEYECVETATGIRAAKLRDDAFSLDRFADSDEELNFEY